MWGDDSSVGGGRSSGPVTLDASISRSSGEAVPSTEFVDFTDGIDPVTHDMVIAMLGDEQGHRRHVDGLLRAYGAEGLA
jgi:hypothetical protein